MIRARIFFALRAVAYAAATAAVGWWISYSSSDAPTVGAIVQAVATIALAAVGIEALVANRQLVRANLALVRATEQEVQVSREQARATTQAAVEAASATAEGRRQWILGRVPLVACDRPRFRNDDRGAVEIVVPVRNFGPGIALDVRLRLEQRDRADRDFRPYGHLGTTVPVLGTDDRAYEEMRIGAHDLVQVQHLGWRRVQEGPLGSQEVDPPPDLLVPEEMRVVIAWQSTEGAKGEHTYRWITRDINNRDPLTWRFERLEVSPGAEAAESLVVTATEL